jgi:hypothetical protein
MESKLLIIIDNQRMLFDKIKSIENRLSTIENRLSTPSELSSVSKKAYPDYELDDDEVILFKPKRS